jgi:hypothetical protein
MVKLAKIRQLFEHRGLDSPREYFQSLLKSGAFNKAISGRKRIAIVVGSRGISNLVVFVRELAEYLKKAGIEVIIVPAMGSHGFATADGQRMVLENLGINEETVGAKILSSMEVVSLGEVKLDGRSYPVYVDRAAWEMTDGVILLNRIKSHSDFIGRYESGLVKMAVVGLGNHQGAEQVHSLGTRGLKELMPLMAEVVFGSDKLLGGFAIVEDAYHNTAGVHWLESSEILEKEPAILEEANSMMPRLPVETIELLLIKQMGKEISGVGIDPKIVGRLGIWGEQELQSPRIELIGVCDITDASYGNALGVGLADFITKKLFEKIDFAALKENILTATFYQRGKIPLVLEDEREMLKVCLRHFQRRGTEQAKVIIIRDTLSLSDMYVSEAILDEIKERSDIEITGEPQEVVFYESNEIVTDF